MTTARPAPLSPPSAGMALIAVLWMTAALSLLVAGMLSISRAEVKATQVRSDLAQATALGDAAIQLAVLDWQTRSPKPDRLLHTDYLIEGRPVAVRLVPASGYVDLNTASQALLAVLLQFGGGLAPAEAETMARRIVDWRDRNEAELPGGAEAPAYAAAGVPWRPRNGSFLVPEDLMQVLGMDFDLYQRIRPLITVWAGGAPGINAYAAPPEVLYLAAQGKQDVAYRIAVARDAGEQGVDLTQLEAAFVRNGTLGNILHVEARLPLDTGRSAIRGRWLLLGADPGGAPWRTIAVEPVRLRADEARG